MTEKTATQIMEEEKNTKRLHHPDVRRHRATALTAALMAELSDVLDDFDMERVHDRLFKALYDNGAAWVTDEDRAALGLEPRDIYGWTPSERVSAEQDRLKAILSLHSAQMSFGDRG